MKVHSSLMGVGGWYETFAAGWLAEMRSKKVPTSTTSARRLAAFMGPLTGGGPEIKPEEEEDRGGSPLGPGGPFSCSQCRGAYPTRDQLEKHETLHSPSTQTCNICYKTFPKMNQLQRHAMSHNESPDLRKYKCNNCDKAFKHNHHLKEHLRIHSGEKPFECLNCGKRFSHSGSYSSHMTSKKCLAMNLKMGRIKSNHRVYNKNVNPGIKQENNSLNVTEETSKSLVHNPAVPMLAKYKEAAAFFASIIAQKPTYNPDPNPGYPQLSKETTQKNEFLPYNFPASFNYMHHLAYQEHLSRNIKMQSMHYMEPKAMVEDALEEEDRKSDSSADLIMDIEDDHNETASERESCSDGKDLNSDPSLTFNSLLQSVNASVNRHFLTSTSEASSRVAKSIVFDDKEDFNDEEDLEDKAREKIANYSDKKIRMRTALSIEQQLNLRDHYSLNPRPNREQFESIAQAVSLDSRVVQVWFQNNRAKERRSNQATSLFDQPLDLSIKKIDDSSPSASPAFGSSAISDSEEAMNLSQKSSRSTTPSHSNFHNAYSHSNCSSPLIDVHYSPTPSESYSKNTEPQISNNRPMSIEKLLYPSLQTYSTDSLGSNRQSWPINDRAISDNGPSNYEQSDKDLSQAKNFKIKEKENRDEERLFACDQCDKTFVKQGSLVRHKYEHSGQRPYKCAECPKAFKHKHHLTEHKRLHTGEKPFQCCKCLKKFSHSGSYSQHMNHRFAICKPYRDTCKICHKSFANVYRLQRHMLSHDESANLRKFKCNDCDKAFKFKHHLKEHLRIHSGEKPFECANCGKKFSHSGSYSSHMTSKKCLVMNLKMGRIKPNNPALNPDRSPSRKRANAMVASQLKHSMAPSGFLPILPKYNEAFFASMSAQDPNYHRPPLPQPGLNPFYMPPGMPMSPESGITPYSFPASLSQLFQQLATQQYHQRKMESPDPKQMSHSSQNVEDLMEEIPEEDDKHSEGSAELVMDIEEDEAAAVKKEHENEANDLRLPYRNYESVPLNNNGPSIDNNNGYNLILDSVHSSVNKDYFRANMETLSPISGNVYPSIDSPPARHSIVKDEPNDTQNCAKCHLTFENKNDLIEHEKLLCGNVFRKHEGLAAQVAETVALNRFEAEIRTSIQSGVSASEDEDFGKDDRDDKSVHDNDRKIRVRTALNEEQQIILRAHFAFNKRPNRDQCKKIAHKIGLDNRVVQVWFQNFRARERRMCLSATPSDQPLDLSTRKSNISVTSSPSPSPPCSISVTHSDSEEAVNLSQKSSRSTTPYRTAYVNPYPHSNCSSSSHTDFRLSPSPGETIAAQKRSLQKVAVNPLIPMDKLLQYNDIANGRSPILNMHMMAEHRQTASPSYDRSAWPDEVPVSRDFDDDHNVLKKSKLKGNEIKEGEGQFVCDQCDKTFVKQSSLARHKYEHSGQRPYKCAECPKAFKHKHHLTEHKRLHTGEKPFQCCKCLKKFSHSGSYSQHMNHRFAICKPYRD